MADVPTTPWARGVDMVATLKERLRIDGDHLDTVIAAGWEEAIDALAPRLNRTLVPAMLVAEIDPRAAEQMLPGRPVIEIDAVEEFGAGGWAAVAADGWSLSEDHVLEQRTTGLARRRCRYVAGYGTDLPGRIMRILVLMVEEALFGVEPNRTRAIDAAIGQTRLPGLA